MHVRGALGPSFCTRSGHCPAIEALAATSPSRDDVTFGYRKLARFLRGEPSVQRLLRCELAGVPDIETLAPAPSTGKGGGVIARSGFVNAGGSRSITVSGWWQAAVTA